MQCPGSQCFLPAMIRKCLPRVHGRDIKVAVVTLPVLTGRQGKAFASTVSYGRDWSDLHLASILSFVTFLKSHLRVSHAYIYDRH
jgi:hypothetical protein